MTQISYSKFAEKWKKTSYPARPCKKELTEVEKIVKKHKKILILGSTPEFRDLGQKYNLDVSLCDVNKTMVNEMSKIMKEKIKMEKVRIRNWLTMDFRDNIFDMILAEQSINIVQIKDFEKFFAETKRVLANNGEFVLCASVFPSKQDFNMSLDQLMKEFNQYGRNINYLWDLLAHTKHVYNNKKRFMSMKKTLELAKMLCSKKYITKIEFNKFYSLCGFICEADLKLHVMFKKEFEKKIKKYFKIKKIIKLKNTKNYNHKYHPIYILGK